MRFLKKILREKGGTVLLDFQPGRIYNDEKAK